MYDRIAVPLDGSVTAYRAIGPARRFARAHDARLGLVSVATPATGGTTDAAEILEQGRERSEVDVETVLLDHDDAAVALGEFDAADPSTVQELVLGSTAADVIRAARVPVLIVSKHGTAPAADMSRFGWVAVSVGQPAAGPARSQI